MKRIERVRKLAEYLGRKNRFPTTTSRDGARLEVCFETGRCTLEEWSESGHNGDPYAETSRVLTKKEAEERLAEVEASLWRDAEILVEEAARKEREAEAARARREAAERAVFGAKR